MGDTVNECNNKYHSTIKMKPVDENSRTYFDFNKESNNQDPKFEVGDHVRISNIKIFLQKVSFQSKKYKSFVTQTK